MLVLEQPRLLVLGRSRSRARARLRQKNKQRLRERLRHIEREMRERPPRRTERPLARLRPERQPGNIDHRLAPPEAHIQHALERPVGDGKIRVIHRQRADVAQRAAHHLPQRAELGDRGGDKNFRSENHAARMRSDFQIVTTNAFPTRHRAARRAASRA